MTSERRCGGRSGEERGQSRLQAGVDRPAEPRLGRSPDRRPGRLRGSGRHLQPPSPAGAPEARRPSQLRAAGRHRAHLRDAPPGTRHRARPRRPAPRPSRATHPRRSVLLATPSLPLPVTTASAAAPSAPRSLTSCPSTRPPTRAPRLRSCRSSSTCQARSPASSAPPPWQGPSCGVPPVRALRGRRHARPVMTGSCQGGGSVASASISRACPGLSVGIGSPAPVRTAPGIGTQSSAAARYQAGATTWCVEGSPASVRTRTR